MGKLKAAWAWTKKHALALALGLVGILGAILGFKAYQKRVGKLKDEKKMLQARTRIAELEGKRKILEKQDAVEMKFIRNIDIEILDNKRKAVEAHASSEGLNNAEVLDEFARLGY